MTWFGGVAAAAGAACGGASAPVTASTAPASPVSTAVRTARLAFIVLPVPAGAPGYPFGTSRNRIAPVGIRPVERATRGVSARGVSPGLPLQPQEWNSFWAA